MVREYTFPDPKDQERKEYVKEVLKSCKSAEERKVAFFCFFGDPAYRAPVLHQALKECNLKDDFSFKEMILKCISYWLGGNYARQQQEMFW